MNNLFMKYFVLSPNSKDKAHADASRSAMCRFADCIEPTNPKLADDIRRWVDDIRFDEQVG